jgi:hypothetical protein
MAVYDARPSSFNQLSLTSEWEYLFAAAGVQDGIDGSTLGAAAMTPSLDTVGRNAVIAAGNVLIKGQLWRCDASVSTPIPAASAQNRIDRLVARLTRGATTSATVLQPVVITGTPSGSPVEPPLVQTTAGIFDIPICSWTSTSAGALTTLVDERDFIIDYWHTVALPSTGGFSGAIRVKKIELQNLCVLDVAIRWTNTAGTLFNTVGNLPPGYYPTTNVPRTFPSGIGGSPTGPLLPSIAIPGSGPIQIYCPASSGGSGSANFYGGTIVYPID